MSHKGLKVVAGEGEDRSLGFGIGVGVGVSEGVGVGVDDDVVHHVNQAIVRHRVRVRQHGRLPVRH
jgi:hypothetical protein